MVYTADEGLVEEVLKLIPDLYERAPSKEALLQALEGDDSLLKREMGDNGILVKGMVGSVGGSVLVGGAVGGIIGLVASVLGAKPLKKSMFINLFEHCACLQ